MIIKTSCTIIPLFLYTVHVTNHMLLGMDHMYWKQWNNGAIDFLPPTYSKCKMDTFGTI